MNPAFPLVPERASSIAGEVDALFLFILGGHRPLRGRHLGRAALLRDPLPPPLGRTTGPAEIDGSLALELTWTIIPLVLMIVMFVWGAKVYFHLNRPPDDAMTVSVVGKRWMWKLQQPTGQREINELHVPVGPRGEARDHLRGRDPQLLRARVPHQEGRGARPLQRRLVPRHEGGHATTSSAPSTAAPSTRG